MFTIGGFVVIEILKWLVFNKFPITLINEAIDELVGVVIFFQAIITIWLSPKSYEQGGYS
jgi:hypothetical protein